MGKTHLRLELRKSCLNRLCDPDTMMLPDEGIDDPGLFKGILIRYLVQLYQQFPENSRIQEVILVNARRLWDEGLDKELDLCGPSWEKKPQLPVQLSVQLSGIMLLEGAAIVQGMRR